MRSELDNAEGMSWIDRQSERQPDRYRSGRNWGGKGVRARTHIQRDNNNSEKDNRQASEIIYIVHIHTVHTSTHTGSCKPGSTVCVDPGANILYTSIDRLTYRQRQNEGRRTVFMKGK